MSVSSSCRGPSFGPQPSMSGSSQLPITPSPGNLPPLSGLHSAVLTCTMPNTYTIGSNVNLTEKKWKWLSVLRVRNEIGKGTFWIIRVLVNLN